MLIWIKEHYRLITAVEGTGDNLLEEDERQGYKDYMMTAIYEQNHEYLEPVEEGQMMSEKMIADMDEEEIVARVLDFWGYKDKDYVILED